MVKVGLDRIEEKEFAPLFKNKKIGLIASCSGISVTYGYQCAIDVMSKIYNVVALFAPEHGSRGVLGPGEKVKSSVDEITGIPSYSLYDDFVLAKDEKVERGYVPQDNAMGDIDVMVFDMQDVGSRYYTYASTLYYTMKACAEKGLPLVVLDRPNPLGGEQIEGRRQGDDCLSFIGLCKVPIRHGLTMGELALFCNGYYHFGCDLTVVPLDGWTRDMYFDDTKLPYVKPSPNLPSFESVVVYNGTCLFAGTNVSEGRGTTTPFLTVGAPYINPVQLAEVLNKKNIEGVQFSPAFFRPNFSKYENEICGRRRYYSSAPHSRGRYRRQAHSGLDGRLRCQVFQLRGNRPPGRRVLRLSV